MAESTDLPSFLPPSVATTPDEKAEVALLKEHLKHAETIIQTSQRGTRLWTVGQELWAILHFMIEQAYSRPKGRPTLGNIMKSAYAAVNTKNPGFAALWSYYQKFATI